ncbi:DUF4232 domain-containing protein [Streptomyces guryensis]|uniref:DUF4232 domain-containing protein n=1 Tax=Streptomyces guryensis TaxID=2886947 RepID=A0A9Q3VYT4_9ACTN|nr:DUF4232 domain-containing protein [Streptomyces guryensis]MCD9880010.1 DUF4232 domain-containing protein [Streptomyces guryensis]
MFNFRASRTRFVGATATVVLAALSLTACNDGTGARAEGASTTAGKTATASAGTSSSATPSPGSNSSSGSSSSSSSAGSSSGYSGAKPATVTTPRSGTRTSSSKAPGSSGGPVTCEGSNTKTIAAPLNRPVNHMLLTVTNTGSRTCYLYGHPAARFGEEAQSVPPVIEDSKPQAVVTLQPGESGYASVNLSATDGSGSNGYTAKSLWVYFQGRSMSGSVGASAHPSLPAKGVYVDDSLKVTYWQQSMDDAVNW